jgi:hypothetical protein
MPDFDPALYGETLAELLVAPPMPLGMPTPNAAMYAKLHNLDPKLMFGTTSKVAVVKAAHAGLWLRHGFWEESHNIAQNLHIVEGSYWHAIQHRIEGDTWNSHYWHRRVGEHPIHTDMAKLDPTWTPESFTDLCVQHHGQDNKVAKKLVKLQQAEWELLFHHCWKLATGG